MNWVSMRLELNWHVKYRIELKCLTQVSLFDSDGPALLMRPDRVKFGLNILYYYSRFIGAIGTPDG